MKILIDIDEDYYEIIKHDVKVNNNNFKPYTIIANGVPIPKKNRYSAGRYITGENNEED